MAADFLGIEFIHYTRHFSKKSVELGKDYPRKLDHDGLNVLTPGIEIYVDQEVKFMNDFFKHIRWTFGHYLDSMNSKSGYLHFGPRFSYTIDEQFQTMFGLGPTFYFRESWNRFEGYEDDGFFQESSSFMKRYQYKFLASGDIDFHYIYSEELQIVWSVIPGLPDVINHATGIRVKW